MPKPGHDPDCCKSAKAHKECNSEMCLRCVVCLEHQFWKANTERRQANGIRLGRICFMADREQARAFNRFYARWTKRHGSKSAATDVMLAAMSEEDARYQDHLRVLREDRRKRREFHS